MVKGIRLDDGAIPADKQQQVCEIVAAHCKERNITHRQLGAAINKTASVVCAVLRGSYSADPDPIIRRLNAWVEEDARRQTRRQPLGHYKTAVFHAVRDLAAYARSNARTSIGARPRGLEQESSRIAIGYAPAGAGKSIGAKALAAEDPLAILVRVDQKRGTDTGLARLICEQAGWRGALRGISPCEFAQEKLENSGRLLIVDEGHRLKASGCEFLRDLADVAGIPILILCTVELYDRLHRVRTARGLKTYAQFSRRVGLVVDLVRGTDGRGGAKRPIYSIDEIRHIFKSDVVRLTQDGAEYLQAIACCVELGMLGLAANVFEIGLRAVVSASKVIDAEVLRKAAKRVLVPMGMPADGLITQVDQALALIRGLPAVAAAG